MDKMNISIAMATYNGGHYLQQQLDSFCAQKLLPDELVVCDDGSGDDTLAILERFSASCPFVVRIICNEKNLGYARNFEKAISLCSGNIIFLSDQDDVWLEHKIEQVVAQFRADASRWVVVSDAMLTDADLKPTGLTVAGQLVAAGLPPEQLLLGCCIAFRQALRPLLLPIPCHLHGHDGWINTLAKALDVRHFDPSVLQLYRRHGTNTSEWLTTRLTPASRWLLLREKMRWSSLRNDPGAASSSRLEHLDTLKGRLKAHEHYLRHCLADGLALEQVMARIDQERAANASRQSLQQLSFWGRLIAGVRFYLAGGYRQFEGWKSLARDIVR